MSFCFRLASAAAFSALLFPACSAAAGLVKQTVAVPHVRSVVRTDARGRLVRTVVVAPRVIQPREVTEETVAAAPRGYSPASGIPEIVEEAARRHDVDPLLVHSVIQVESNYNPLAVSPKGACGIMQLMPATARRFGVSNVFDPRQNIDGGVRYLKHLQTLFPNDMRLAIAAYNAGEGAVWKYNNQIPPYAETEQYVYKVGRRYGQARREAERLKTPASVAVAAPPGPASSGPDYASVEAYVDDAGRLHMRTVETGAGAPATP